MNVKIDTKEKFHVITIQEPVFSGNMTEEWKQILDKTRENVTGNVIINMSAVIAMDAPAAESLAAEQQQSYEKQQSLVLCCLQPSLEEWLDKQEILELLNTTPTESEAWDIVQMEEIERELDL
ncbi:STAS domain-containing protein [Pollutibacter soli]|uniref:STAS domain-containing protein n=1 Tax=Pollutibacter soli TaxID=3034157 RepID=UPI003013732A